jgi:hypothetical protein
MGPTRLVGQPGKRKHDPGVPCSPVQPRGSAISLFLQQAGPGVWGYYSLAATKVGASALTGGHEASFINRAAALYEHFAGLPAFAGSPVKR